MARGFGYFGTLIFVLVLAAGLAWTVTALRVHLEGLPLYAAVALVALVGIGALVVRGLRGRRMGWAVLGFAAVAVIGWYATIRPSDSRDWAVDVSRGVKARVEGNIVSLTDVRDFAWKDEDNAEYRWIDASYDLDKLATIDMLTSVWDSPDIAHLLVSFGFDDGEHVVFSVEIRREADEEFNEVGGFFRQFELVLIGATEDDIVKLRTNHREEDVSLYPVDLNPDQRRQMFMSFVALARQLEEAPAFYNTITANCTTTVYRLAQVLKDDLPIDERLVLSGRLPEYLDDLGVLGGEGSIADRRGAALITPRAQAVGPGEDFSAAIRGR